MAKKVRTLFIRDDAINLVVVDGKKIKNFASLRLEPGLVSHGLIVDEPQVARELEKLFELTKESMGKVIVGLSGINSLYRLISLPELPADMLPEAVKREAERMIPVPLDEIYLSYQRIPSPPGKMLIFLAIFPRNMADALVRTLRKAGIKPHIMDLAPLALCRAMDEPRAIIVNAKSGSLDIMIMEDRLPQLIRTVYLPGETTSIHENLPAIIEEIDRTVTFHNSQHKDNLLDSTVPMFICGDLVEVPESWQSLSGNLNCPVSTLSSSLESPEGFNASEFMVNIGLALKQLPYEKQGANYSLVNFNALPEIYLPKAVPLSTIFTVIGAIIGIGLIVYMGFILYNNMSATTALASEVTSTESRVNEEQRLIAELKPQVAEKQALVEAMEATTSIFINTYMSLEAGRALMNGDMNIIIGLLPKDTDLAEVHYGSSSKTISGIVTKTDAEDDIFRYAENLRVYFSSVIISSIKAEEDEEGQIEGFRFKFIIK